MSNPIRLPRIPGFKYAPKLRQFASDSWYVCQKGHLYEASIHGPCKPTESEAIKAWCMLAKRLNGGSK